MFWNPVSSFKAVYWTKQLTTMNHAQYCLQKVKWKRGTLKPVLA